MRLANIMGVLLVLCVSTVQANVRGTNEVAYPQRIVALEYSFVDALAVVGISPVGIADDHDPERIIPQVRERIQPWTSLGIRSQPNLEVIAQLKPDLIIADAHRHRVSLDDLNAIAPTLLLKSRGESYQDSLNSALTIGQAVGKSSEMQARIAQHRAFIEAHRGRFQGQGNVQFANVNDRGMWLHGPQSYTGSLLAELGLQPAMPELTESHLVEANFELLLKVNPDWLFFSKRSTTTLLDQWQDNPLFRLLNISDNQQAIEVSPQVWSLNRGILAAEAIVRDLEKAMAKSPQD